MKNIIVLINFITGTIILWSYDLYDLKINVIFTEIDYIYLIVLLSLFLFLNIVLFLKDQKELLKYEFLGANLLLNSYLGKIFIKISYFEKQWYDVVYQNSLLSVIRHYNKNEYNTALNEYIAKKYPMSEIFTEEVKNTIVSHSKSMSQMFSLVDKYNIEKTPIDLSMFYKIISYCSNHPVLIITTLTGIIGCFYLSYYNIDKIQVVLSKVIATLNIQNDNTLKGVEIDKRFNEAINLLQQEVTKIDGKLTRTVDSSVKLTEEVIGLLSRTEKIEKFFKMLIYKVVENSGSTNTLVIEDIIKKLTESI